MTQTVKPPVKESLIIENARIMFRNFSGLEREYNSAGDRNFCVFLDPDQAEALREIGWNIKQLKPRPEDTEDDIPQHYMQVKLNYGKGQPPRCVLISSKGRVDLGQDEVGALDVADIKKVDLIINPYNWTVRENSGVKAYLKSIFVTIKEDELELKYADVHNANQRPDENDPED